MLSLNTLQLSEYYKILFASNQQIDKILIYHTIVFECNHVNSNSNSNSDSDSGSNHKNHRSGIGKWGQEANKLKHISNEFDCNQS